MPRIQPLRSELAPRGARDLFDSVEERLGRVPNFVRTLGHAPAALEGLLALSDALERTSLGPKVGARIGLAVSEANDCEYCLAVHGALGVMQGLTADEVSDSRRGTSTDRRTEAVLRFALRVVETRGRVEDADLATARRAGLADAEMLEVVAHVARDLFTNYLNHLARPELDYPPLA